MAITPMAKVLIVGHRSQVPELMEALQQAGVAEIMDAPVRRRDGEDVDISLPRFREFALNLVDQIFRVDEEDDAPHQS